MENNNNHGDSANAEKANHDKRKQRGRGPLVKLILGLAVMMAILLVIGLLPRLVRARETRTYVSDIQKAPSVNVVSVANPPAFDDLDLPGNIQALQQTAVVARSSGYVKQWLVDIGDRVHAGQVMATVESPDLDQQVTQARAQLGSSQASFYQARAYLSNQQAALAQSQAAESHSSAALEQARTQLAQARASLAQSQEQLAQQQAQVVQAQANLDLARVTATRYENLLKDGAIDRETADQNMTAYETNKANVAALQAAVRAGEQNVQAYTAAVGSSQANVSAATADVRSSAAAVAAAGANVRSGQANVQVAASNIRSSQANVNRFVVLQQWENVTAPFSGVVTARNVDNGTLISSGGSPTSGSSDISTVGSIAAGVSANGNPASGSSTAMGSGSTAPSGSQPTSMFSIAQLGTVRVYVSVPQAYVDSLHEGDEADVTVSALQGQTFHGRVVRNAEALDAASRTLVTEVDLSNPRNLLRPGMFAAVHFHIPHQTGVLIIPDTALVTNAQGNQAVTIGADNKVHFVPITVGRDFGQVIEVTSGLQPGQHIAMSPSDALREGETVHANYVTLPPATGGANQPGARPAGGASQAGGQGKT